MNQLNFVAADSDASAELQNAILTPLRMLGLATLTVGAVTLGLYLGRELRFRYQFRRRTPSDFFSNAGDPIANADYGMGI